FSCGVTGASLSYQWQLSTNSGSTWANISSGGVYTNATSSNLGLTGITTGMHNYQYRCVITNPCSVTTNAVSLNVLAVPSITGNPSSNIACPGSAVSYMVSATGTTLTYQWQEYTTSWTNITNGGIYSGATTNNLSISAVNV